MSVFKSVVGFTVVFAFTLLAFLMCIPDVGVCR